MRKGGCRLTLRARSDRAAARHPACTARIAVLPPLRSPAAQHRGYAPVDAAMAGAARLDGAGCVRKKRHGKRIVPNPNPAPYGFRPRSARRWNRPQKCATLRLGSQQRHGEMYKHQVQLRRKLGPCRAIAARLGDRKIQSPIDKSAQV